MSFASDVTDRIQLVSDCSTHSTYEQRLRIQRNRLAVSGESPYIIVGLLIATTGLGYLRGSYLTLAIGSPLLLVQVQSVNVYGGITSVAILNAPVIRSVPTGAVPSTDISYSGSGATFDVLLDLNPAICCPCAPTPTPTPTPTPPPLLTLTSFAVLSADKLKLDSITIANPGSGYFEGQILQVVYGSPAIIIGIDRVTASGGIAAFSIFPIQHNFSEQPQNPVPVTVGTATFTVTVKA